MSRFYFEFLNAIVDIGRYYALYRRNNKLEIDESKYNQLRPNDVRIATDGQQRWRSTSQPASAAQPHYLYATDSNDA